MWSYPIHDTAKAKTSKFKERDCPTTARSDRRKIRLRMMPVSYCLSYALFRCEVSVERAYKRRILDESVISYDKSQHIFRGSFLPAFSFESIALSAHKPYLPVSLREHEANDAYQRPWPKCEPSLKIRFFTISYSWSGPHGASCEKRKPASTIFTTCIPQITLRCTPSFPRAS